MLSSAFSSLIVLFCALVHFTSVLALPVDSLGLDSTARKFLSKAKRATPAAPHFVIYSDRFVSGETGPPDVSQVEVCSFIILILTSWLTSYFTDFKGFNVFALSFLLTEGAFDKAEEWTQLSASQRSAVKSQYANAGIRLIVSLFGSTDAPTSTGADPTATANIMAAWVREFDLDGVDVDYEDFNAINAGDGSAEAWLTTFTRQLRNQLPQGDFILTHAPVAPWFSPNRFGGGAYLTVNENVGDLIDWYNVQVNTYLFSDCEFIILIVCRSSGIVKFYNQGTNEYTTCAGLLTSSSSTWPESALFQIAANGVDLNKLVIGKPATSADASNGFIDPSTLAGCVAQARNRGWDAGVMVWEFPDAAADWIATVRSQAFPE
ncbi:hypothetical protein ACEPAI_8755 [Sanghuangporus weigelae]